MTGSISEVNDSVCLNNYDKLEQTKVEDKTDKVASRSLIYNSPEIRSCKMWDCTAITPLKDGGSISTFVFKQSRSEDLSQHDEYVKKNLFEIFPAIECVPISHPSYFSLNSLNCIFAILGYEDLRDNEELIELLTELGFKYEYVGTSYQLSLPDREALEKGWEKYRKDSDYLSPLKIADSEGVATDEEFVEAIFNCHAILSTGKEFIHDSSTHIIVALALLLEAKSAYPEIKKKFIDTINLFYEPIKWAKENKMNFPYEQLTAIVGIMVDTFTTVPPKRLIKELDNPLVEKFSRLNKPLTNFTWMQYFKKRFQIYSVAEIIQAWDQMLSTYYATQAGFSKKAIEQILEIEEPISSAVFLLSQVKSHTDEDLDILKTSADPYAELKHKYKKLLKSL